MTDISNTTITSGATLPISSGMLDVADLVLNGGIEIVMSGGQVFESIVYQGGEVFVEDSGSFNSGVVSGGTTTIQANGTAVSDCVFANGLIVNDGGSTNDIVVSAGGMYILNAGTASATSLSQGGTLQVYSEGCAVSTAVSGASSVIVNSGGCASNTNIAGTSSVTVNEGGLAADTQIGLGGALNISAGGDATTTTAGSGGILQVLPGGIAVGVDVSSGGYANIAAGGTASDLTVEQGGYVVISGSASDIAVQSGGAIFELSGSNVSEESGTGQVLSGGMVETVTTSGGPSSTTFGAAPSNLAIGTGVSVTLIGASTTDTQSITSGGAETVETGAIASGTTITWNGTLSVGSGGFSSDTTLGPNGFENVLAGGSATNVSLINNSFWTQASINVFGKAAGIIEVGWNNFAAVASGGIITDGTVGSGNNFLTVRSGGDAQNLTVSGNLTVDSGGTAENISLANGIATVSGGTVSAMSILSGGLDEIASAGSSLGATVSQFGQIQVENGGVAISSAVLGGIISVVSGGVASSTVIHSGYMIVAAGGTASGTVVSAGGDVIALPGSNVFATSLVGGSVINTGVVDLDLVGSSPSVNVLGAYVSGGVEATSTVRDVLSGGLTTSNTITAGGSETIFAGGQGQDVTVIGGTISVSGGSLNNAVVTSGSINVAGGVVSNVTLSQGSTLHLSSGTAYNTNINNGGTEIVSSNGTATSNLISAGGTFNVLSGGTAEQTTIQSGGFAVIGGVANDVSVAAGGTVIELVGSNIGNFESAGQEFSSGVVDLTGTLNVATYLGSTVVSDVVPSLCSQYVLASGTDLSTTIVTGSTLVIEAGGTLVSVNETGGTLIADPNAVIGSVTIDISDLAGISTTGGDDSAIINAAIAAIPSQASSIVLEFGPGNYGVSNTILIGSNTSVIGNGATLSGIWTPNYGALIANKDSYDYGLNLIDKNTDGTTTVISGDLSSGANQSITNNSSTAVIDKNIQVKGITFNNSATGDFGTWFTNAQNVDIQDNVYVNGGDGNAFVDVVNGIVADNIGMVHDTSYDNWNGPTNITVEDNSMYLGGPGGGSELINADVSGNPANIGNAVNDAFVGNLFTGYSVNGFSEAAYNLDGFTSETDITQQGNIISANELPNWGTLYTGGITHDLIQDDLLTGINFSLIPNSIGSYNLISATAREGSPSDATIVGNLIFGASETGEANPLILNDTNDPTTLNNADLNQTAYQANAIVTVNEGGTATVAGNIQSSGTTLSGSGVEPTLDIAAFPNEFVSANTATAISGATIIDPNMTETLSVTLTTTFGTLSVGGSLPGIVYETINNQPAVVLTGDAGLVNADLSSLVYTSNAGGWDDAIEITVSNIRGSTATRYIPVLVETSATSVGDLTLYPSSAIVLQNPNEASLGVAGTLVPEPSLNGEIAIASQGDNLITMGSTISEVYLGLGTNTVLAGGSQAYIACGSGDTIIDLEQGGSITVAGGAGDLSVDATTGNNLIETGAAQANVESGAGSNTVLAGVGNLTIDGGSGTLYVATLPQDAGSLTVQLGTGNATVFALSGQVDLTSETGTSNFISLGIGSGSVRSGGQDTIFAGAGPSTVDATSGGNDLIVGGSGSLTFIAGSSGSATIDLGSGNLSISGPESYNLSVDIASLSGAARTISFGQLTFNVSLVGGLSISSQNLVGDEMNLVLSDGTKVLFSDPLSYPVQEINGDLVESTNIIEVPEGGFVSLGESYNDGVTWSIVGASGGNDTINVSNQSSSISAPGNNNVFGLYGAQASVNALGSGNLIAANGGQYDILVAGAGNAVLISGGSETVDAAAGSSGLDVFFIGTGNGKLYFINSSLSAASLTGGFGDATGSATVYGGAAGGFYEGGEAGNNSLIGGSGSGATTLIGSGNNNFLSVQGAGANVMFADNPSDTSGGGSATLVAGASTNDNDFIGGSGTEILVSYGAGSQNFFVGLSGSETLTGSTATGASNNYYFNQTPEEGGGSDYIINFNIARDNVFINPFASNPGSVSIQNVISTSFSGNAGTIIELTDNTSINLPGCVFTAAQTATLVGSTHF